MRPVCWLIHHSTISHMQMITQLWPYNNKGLKPNKWCHLKNVSINFGGCFYLTETCSIKNNSGQFNDHFKIWTLWIVMLWQLRKTNHHLNFWVHLIPHLNIFTDEILIVCLNHKLNALFPFIVVVLHVGLLTSWDNISVQMWIFIVWIAFQSFCFITYTIKVPICSKWRTLAKKFREQ